MINLKVRPAFLATFIVVFFSMVQISNIDSVNSFRDRLDYLAYDLRLNLFIDEKKEKDDRIVIIEIDEKSLRSEGRWPWSRHKIGNMVENISDAGATVIAFDVIFSDGFYGINEMGMVCAAI